MSDYYRNKLSADRLHRCYGIAPARTRQYLCAEIDFVQSLIDPDDRILEIGSGYGRVLHRLARTARFACGIDISLSSLKWGGGLPDRSDSCHQAVMDAGQLGFCDNAFQATICIQNGLSACRIPPKVVMKEALRVTAPGGVAIFSSYAESFWANRLAWFEMQARAGLLGPIDYARTGGGVIVCTDGFRTDTISPTQFESLAASLHLKSDIIEIDKSSLFCILNKA